MEYGGQPSLISSSKYRDGGHGQAILQISVEIHRWVAPESDQKDAESSEFPKRSVVGLSILRVITYRGLLSRIHAPVSC